MKYTLRPLTDGNAFKIYSLVCDGTCKTTEFLSDVESNDPEELDKVMAFLERCATHGPPKNKEKSRPVGGGIFEAKTTTTRICYFYDAGKMIICTHGFYKPQPKVQNSEIKAAQKTLKNYKIAKSIGPIKIEEEKESK